MIEETIQKLTASIDALTAQLGAYNTVAMSSLERQLSRQETSERIRATLVTSDQAGGKTAFAEAVASSVVAEAAKVVSDAPKPDSIKKLKAKAAAEIAAAKAAETPAAPVAETTKLAEPEAPKLPEQKDVIDIAGQLLVATNQNDGGFLRNLAKELGLDKLRNAKPEQRQAVIDRIAAEIARVNGGAAA